jgi:hypothetical protein
MSKTNVEVNVTFTLDDALAHSTEEDIRSYLYEALEDHITGLAKANTSNIESIKIFMV